MGAYQEPTIYRKHEKGLLRADGEPGFNTVIGLFELDCVMFSQFGDDGLPFYEEATLSPVSQLQLAAEYPLEELSEKLADKGMNAHLMMP